MNLANKISILRIILIPFFIAAIVYSRTDIALIFFIAAVITDGVDGFIARTQNQKTQLELPLLGLSDANLQFIAYLGAGLTKYSLDHIVPICAGDVVCLSDSSCLLGRVYSATKA